MLALLAACAPRAATPVEKAALTQAAAPLENPSVIQTMSPQEELATLQIDSLDEKDVVKKVVTGFGRQLQNVSLLAPDASEQLRQAYAKFVAPDLLESWAADPGKAPGRTVSSPWPDRIEVHAITKTGKDAYWVTADIVEITSAEWVSGGAAGTIPIQLTLRRIEGRWLIVEFERVSS